MVVSNLPYVPAVTDAIHDEAPNATGTLKQRPRVAGSSLRAPDHLRGGGSLLVVHSSICAEDRTRRVLEDGGLAVDLVARRRGPLGPLMKERTATLERRGLLQPASRSAHVARLKSRPMKPTGESTDGQYSVQGTGSAAFRWTHPYG